VYGAPDENGAWNVWSVDVRAQAAARIEIADAVSAQPAPGGGWFFTRPSARGLWRTAAAHTAPIRVRDDLTPGNALGWTVTADAIYYVATRDYAVRLRRAALDGASDTEIATLTQFSWPGFSVAPDGTILFARWDRRDSNLMSIEY
jgi:hypothetical protein